jgi:hypothetical protein
MVRKFVRLGPKPPNQNVLGGVTKREREREILSRRLFIYGALANVFPRVLSLEPELKRTPSLAMKYA